MKQLQDDEDTLESERWSGGELGMKNWFGDGRSTTFAIGENDRFDCWPSNHGGIAFSCCTAPNDLDPGTIRR